MLKGLGVVTSDNLHYASLHIRVDQSLANRVDPDTVWRKFLKGRPRKRENRML